MIERKEFQAQLDALGELIKTERLARGMTKRQLAEAIGVTPNVIGLLERNKVTQFYWPLAAALGALGYELRITAERKEEVP